MVILFLDDDENRIQKIRDCDTIVYVRNKEQFEAYLRDNPLPDVICYDHDLAHEHYIKQNNLGGPPNGEDLAKWAVEHGYVPQIVVVHSWNSDGAKRIVAAHEGTGAEIYVKVFTPYKSLFEM